MLNLASDTKWTVFSRRTQLSLAQEFFLAKKELQELSTNGHSQSVVSAFSGAESYE